MLYFYWISSIIRNMIRIQDFEETKNLMVPEDWEQLKQS